MESISKLNGLRPRSCWLEIDLDELIHNLNFVRERLTDDQDIIAVVKAEAYGHGAEMIAHELSKYGVNYVGVATLEEALKLRNFGIETNILIMGHTATYTVDVMLDYDVTPMIYSYRMLKALNAEAKSRSTRANFHLKVDTGMGRLGLLLDDLEDFFDEINAYDYVNLEGVATHLAEAGIDPEYTSEQYDAFRSVQKMAEDANIQPDFWHCMNSAAIFSDSGSLGNMVRPGISLYGYCPTESSQSGRKESLDLHPVMQVKTKMADYKQIPAGKGVSYGRVFKPDEPTWIGVLPIGYADGYSRSFTEKAHVLKNDRTCSVLGSVCMDMTVIKLEASDDPEEIVIVMGRSQSHELWADTLARWADTIPYEILSGFSDRLPRIYFRDETPVALKSEHGVEFLNDITRNTLGIQ